MSGHYDLDFSDYTGPGIQFSLSISQYPVSAPEKYFGFISKDGDGTAIEYFSDCDSFSFEAPARAVTRIYISTNSNNGVTILGGRDVSTLNDNLISGHVRFDATLGKGDDLVRGSRYEDMLDGGAGKDRLLGGNGDDILRGGSGFDRLAGGAGDDTFVFKKLTDSSVDRPDAISDFRSGDLIDLATIHTTSFDQRDQFTFIGTAAFSGVAGEVRQVVHADGSILVQGDVDADGVADFAIRVFSDHTLIAADFVL